MSAIEPNSPHRGTVGDLKMRCVRAIHGGLGHVFEHVGADCIRGDVVDVELLAVTRFYSRRCALVVVRVRVDRCDGIRFWADQVDVVQPVPLVDRDRGAALAQTRIDY